MNIERIENRQVVPLTPEDWHLPIHASAECASSESLVALARQQFCAVNDMARTGIRRDRIDYRVVVNGLAVYNTATDPDLS